MLYKIVVLLNIIFLSFIWSVPDTSSKIIKKITYATSFFLIEYTGVSALFLFFNAFCVEIVLIIMTAVNILLIFKFRIRIKKNYEIIDFCIKGEMLILLLVLISSGFVSLKCERLKTDGDAGIYYEKALALQNPRYSSTLTMLEEYGSVDKTVDAHLMDLQKQQIGLYPYYVDKDVFLYEYHGLPTWPAYMALWGKMQGILNSPQALTTVFILGILCLYFLIENINDFYWAKFLSIPLFALLPLTIYLAKTPLVEMMYVMFLILGVLLLSEKSDFLKLLSIFPLGLLGYIHFSTFMYMPIIMFGLLGIYILTKRKVYCFINIGVGVLFIFSLIYSLRVSRAYSLSQLRNTLRIIFSSDKACIIAIVVFVLLMLVLQILCIKFAKIRSGLEHIYTKYFNISMRILIVLLIAFTLYQGYLLGFTNKYSVGEGSWLARSNYSNKGFYAIRFLNIVAIIMTTSYVGIPYILINLFSKKKYTIYYDMLLSIFVYSWAIYTIIRCDTPSTYYGARYFMVILVPTVIIMIGISVKTKKCFYIISAIALITALPFSIFQMNTTPYGNNRAMLEDAIKTIENGSIVTVPVEDFSTNVVFVHNLRILNNNRVYSYDDIESIRQKYANEKMYIISSQKMDNPLYQEVLNESYKLNSDIISFKGYYPLSIGSSMKTIYIYQLAQPN